MRTACADGQRAAGVVETLDRLEREFAGGSRPPLVSVLEGREPAATRIYVDETIFPGGFITFDSFVGATGDEVLARELYGREPSSAGESALPAFEDGYGLPLEIQSRDTSPAGQETLLSWPDEEEGRAHAQRLAQLSDLELLRFLALAKDEMDASEVGTYVGLDPDEIDTGLDSRGWVTRARIATGDGPILVARLTEAGREPARLLTALGDIPAYAGPITGRIADLPQSRDDDSLDDDIPF